MLSDWELERAGREIKPTARIDVSDSCEMKGKQG
jgi:hypothetical protein